MAAIVTTLRIGDVIIDPIFSFVGYHLSIGFEHIYCFLDHESNSFLSDLITEKFGSKYVTVFTRSAPIDSEQKRLCELHQRLEIYLENEVPARQTLNAEYAYHIATASGYRWLLHIDIDELFYIDGAELWPDDCKLDKSNVANHFDFLDSIGTQCMTYTNHEGVPELFDSDDYFQSTTLFRRHHFNLPVNAHTTRGIDYWRSRTTYQQYFLVYDNGKSAVKLGIKGAVPKNVHTWSLPTDAAVTSTVTSVDDIDVIQTKHSEVSDALRYRTALLDPRTLKVKHLLRINQPCILHFVTCGYRWLLDKYKILGRFPSFWFGDKLPIAPSFHLNARDIVMGSGADHSNDVCIDEQEDGEKRQPNSDLINTAKFFVEQIMFSCQPVEEAIESIRDTLSVQVPDLDNDAFNSITRSLSDNSTERDTQLHSGVLMRLHRVQNILNKIKHFDTTNANIIAKSSNRDDSEWYVAQLRDMANQVPSEDMSADRYATAAADIARNEVKNKKDTAFDSSHISGDKNVLMQSDTISELDRLRIISQVAYNFL